MEQLKLPEPGLVAPPVKAPVQLSLWWNDALTEERASVAPGVQCEPLEASLPMWKDGADVRRDEVIEAGTRRAKIVCVSLLGFLLLGLRYLDS